MSRIEVVILIYHHHKSTDQECIVPCMEPIFLGQNLVTTIQKVYCDSSESVYKKPKIYNVQVP
jgi:hypothetical protein